MKREAPGSRPPLMVERVLDPVIEMQFPPAAGLAPLARDLAPLHPFPFSLVDVGEVRVQFEREGKPRPLLCEVSQVYVLVQPVAGVAGEAQFERLLGDDLHLPAAGVAFLTDARRQGDVVAEPGVLLDVRERDGARRLAVDQIPVARQQPRLVHEQAVIRAAADEAVAVGGEHGAALAHVERAVARAQPHQIILRPDDHPVSCNRRTNLDGPQCRT